MKARDLLAAHDIWVCSESADVQEVAELMIRHNAGAIPVLDLDGQLEGIATDRDICRRVVGHRHSSATPVRDIMSRSIHSVHPEADLQTIERTRREFKIRRRPRTAGCRGPRRKGRVGSKAALRSRFSRMKLNPVAQNLRGHQSDRIRAAGLFGALWLRGRPLDECGTQRLRHGLARVLFS